MEREQIANGALDALEFAEGAILDAIAHEDGLDGATGLVVLKMIWEQLALHGRSRTTTNEVVDWLEGQYKVDAPHNPVSLQNKALVADANEMANIIGCLEPDEDGCPACDPLCIACRYTKAAWPRQAAHG